MLGAPDEHRHLPGVCSWPPPPSESRGPCNCGHSVSLAHSYRRRARQLSTLHRDQPGHPVQRAVYWIEYVLRHRGAPHLRAAVHQLSFWQYFLLDVAAVLLLAAALLYAQLARAAPLVYRWLRSCWPGRKPSMANGRHHNGVLNGRCRRNGRVPHEKKAK